MKKLLVSLAGLALAATAQAQTWFEVGDAGDLPGTAQIVFGSGPLSRIEGTISTDTDVDLYMIRIKNPLGFSAVVTSPTTGDTQIWLFALDGTGIAHNDDRVGLLSGLTGADVFTTGMHTGSTIASLLTAGGDYLLGISRYNRDALGGTAAIFANSPFNGIHSRTATALPLSGWTNTSGTGFYAIELREANFIPAPGALALVGLAGLVAGRRRR